MSYGTIIRNKYLFIWGDMENYSYIKKNYEALCLELDSIAERLGVPRATLVCVTKSGTDEELLALAGFGAADIGENRPGELKRRGELLLGEGFEPRLHEIGTLQRNKVKYIIDKVALIHSLDSYALAVEIDKRAAAVGRRVPVLIEVNSAREAAKGGIMPEDVEAFAESLSALSSIEVKGLMTMGPALDNPEDVRPYFRLTKEIFDKLKNRQLFSGEPVLSMGMSDSYKVAIEEGSTLVRVGRKLFNKGECENV